MRMKRGPWAFKGLNAQAESQEKGKMGMENLTFQGLRLSPEIPALGKQTPHPVPEGPMWALNSKWKQVALCFFINGDQDKCQLPGLKGRHDRAR